ncbi:hypothetical protein ACIVBQ_000875 [Tenacibaculum discolor]
MFIIHLSFVISTVPLFCSSNYILNSFFNQITENSCSSTISGILPQKPISLFKK